MPRRAPIDPEDLPPILRETIAAVESRLAQAGAELPDSRRKDWLIGELATRQDGFVAIWQLLLLDICSQDVDDRLRLGRLHRVHRAVFAVGHLAPSTKGNRRAALLLAGDTAVFSHRTAADIGHVWATDHSFIEISIQTNAGSVQTPDEILIHRPSKLTAVDITEAHGFPITTPARTILDLAGVLEPHELGRVLKSADYNGRLDLGAITEAARRVSRPRGIRILRRLLLDYDDTPGVPHTLLERQFRRFCRKHRIPIGEAQAELLDGRRRADFLYRDAGAAIELDGRSTHARLGALADDRRRDLELSAIGLRTIRLGAEDLRGEREAATAILLRATVRRESGDSAAA